MQGEGTPFYRTLEAFVQIPCTSKLPNFQVNPVIKKFESKLSKYLIKLLQKKLQRLDQVHFKKNYNDWIRPPLVIFLWFFQKNYNDWIKVKLSKCQTKWTGLRSVFRVLGIATRLCSTNPFTVQSGVHTYRHSWRKKLLCPGWVEII